MNSLYLRKYFQEEISDIFRIEKSFNGKFQIIPRIILVRKNLAKQNFKYPLFSTFHEILLKNRKIFKVRGQKNSIKINGNFL